MVATVLIYHRILAKKRRNCGKLLLYFITLAPVVDLKHFLVILPCFCTLDQFLKDLFRLPKMV